MGCGSSQHTPQVVETGKPADAEKHSAKIKSQTRVYPTTGIIRVESAQKSKDKKLSKSDNKSDTDSAVASRNSSAVSSSSKNSADSGLGVHDPLVLEPASPRNNKEGQGKTDDLFVNRGPSGKLRSIDESEIIEKLRAEGLISRPKSVASGMSFEIAVVAEDQTPNRRLPPRLQRLENVQEEKKSMTEDDIKAKLAKAAERRKKKREAKANRPPRPSTRASMLDALDALIPDEATAIPNVRTSHPESEPLRPPPLVHFNLPSPPPIEAN